MQSSTARTALELSPTCPKVGWAQELCSLISPSPETKPQSHLSWMEAMTQCNSFLLLATASTQFHILPLLILSREAVLAPNAPNASKAPSNAAAPHCTSTQLPPLNFQDQERELKISCNTHAREKKKVNQTLRKASKKCLHSG